MAHITRPYHNVEQKATSVETNGWLYNFAIGSRIPRQEHRLWLHNVAIPMLKEDRSRVVYLFGMASRSGNADYNKKLSEDRTSEIKKYLMDHGVRRNQFVFSHGRGEGAAERAGEDDGREDSYYRAVEVVVRLDYYD